MRASVTSFVLASLAVGCSESGSLDFDEPVDVLAVETPEGHIDVDATRSGPEIGVDYVRWGRHTSVDHDVHDGVLELLTDCAGSVCAVDYDITAPRTVHLELSTLDGWIAVRGGDAGAELFADGSIDVDGLGGPWLDATTDVGWVEATHLAVGEAVLTTGEGDVIVDFDLAPGLVDVATSIGHVDVVVPFGRYALDISAGGFIFVDDIVEDPSASHRIVVFTGVGDVSVRGY
jgi:hypothetical protein